MGEVHRSGHATHSGLLIGMGMRRSTEVDMPPIQAFYLEWGCGGPPKWTCHPFRPFNWNGDAEVHRSGHATHSGLLIGMGMRRPTEVGMPPIQAIKIGSDFRKGWICLYSSSS